MATADASSSVRHLQSVAHRRLRRVSGQSGTDVMERTRRATRRAGAPRDRRQLRHRPGDRPSRPRRGSQGDHHGTRPRARATRRTRHRGQHRRLRRDRLLPASAVLRRAADAHRSRAGLRSRPPRPAARRLRRRRSATRPGCAPVAPPAGRSRGCQHGPPRWNAALHRVHRRSACNRGTLVRLRDHRCALGDGQRAWPPSSHPSG